MRDEFARAMVALAGKRSDLVFLTADVGYLAVEAIAEACGERFINVGVAEQNMVSMAAGLAREGHRVWVYGMAPFVAFRPYEQIRTDVCLHRLPVKLVGNGGGYGYGIMGPTHHAVEDVGALRVLPNLRLYLPLGGEDLPRVVEMMADDPLPNYLRLNAAAPLPAGTPPFAPWRKIKPGRTCVVIGMGPVLGNLYELSDRSLLDELEIWNVGVLPLEDLPADLLASIRQKQRVVIVEEHYRACGLAEALSYLLLKQGVCPTSFTSLHAQGYPSGRYGSQRWHQEENGLAGPELQAHLERVVRG
ncbi:MAG TPA: transketolase [Polyangia bacterium]|nr:transketolase [Polyangia bacterium]